MSANDCNNAIGHDGAGGDHGRGNDSHSENATIWKGKKNDSLKVPKDPKSQLARELSKFGVSGIVYRDGVVDFSPVSCYDIDFSDEEELYRSLSNIPIGKLMTDEGFKGRDEFNGIIRKQWQKQAKQQLLNQILTDSIFAKDFQGKTGVDISKVSCVDSFDDELKRVGLTMHETLDCSKIQLVPTIIHDAFRHSGGTSAMLEKLISGEYHEKYYS